MNLLLTAAYSLEIAGEGFTTSKQNSIPQLGLQLGGQNIKLNRVRARCLSLATLKNTDPRAPRAGDAADRRTAATTASWQRLAGR